MCILMVGVFFWLLTTCIIAWKMSEKKKNPDLLPALIITGTYLGVLFFLIVISIIDNISLLPGIIPGE